MREKWRFKHSFGCNLSFFGTYAAFYDSFRKYAGAYAPLGNMPKYDHKSQRNCDLKDLKRGDPKFGTHTAYRIEYAIS